MTPLDVLIAICNWIAFYWVFAWWGWWFLLAFIVLFTVYFAWLCADADINPFAIPVVVVNDKDDDE